MIHIHDLDGCAPAPLAHYLKALGILRLVSEQADSQARGWWDGERFRLATTLSRDKLQTFFLEQYEPTPLVAPWNKGSGFYRENDPGLSPIEKSTAPRFKKLREGVTASKNQLDELIAADKKVREIKAETKIKGISREKREAIRNSREYKKRLAVAENTFKKIKSSFIPQIRLTWRGRHREWMDAAMVLTTEGKAQFPALLGTGGNDGRLDFTNNYFQRLSEVFDLNDPCGTPTGTANRWLKHSLWNEAITGCQVGKAVGQYFPGSAGGANASVGPESDSLLNPFDFILMMEGSVLFTAHTSRRLGTLQAGRAAAPFVVGAQGAGYASAADSDESARGEQWMPLWSQPLTLTELRRLLAEGRAQLGTRAVHEPLDMAKAVARLGTARGITAFQRYGYIERNGQANLAVPLGRFRVHQKMSSLLSCLDDLEAWLPRLRLDSRDTKTRKAPTRLKAAERCLADALFAVTQHPDERSRWQTVILALADVEAVLVTVGATRCGPIPRLRPEWIRAADDGSAEIRLAMSLALQGTTISHGKIHDTVRRHWITRGEKTAAVVMGGRSGIEDAIALVERRLIEASQRNERRLPLVAARKADATLSDLSALLAGHVDLDRTLAMARVIMAVDSSAWAAAPQPLQQAENGQWPDDAWLVVRLALLPWPLPDGRAIGTDPAVLRRLQSGDAATAIDLARRRLQASGINVTIREGTVPPETARLWAAALAFPISLSTAKRMASRLDP